LPLWVTAEAVPLTHKLELGAVVKLPPLEVPQTPFTVASVREAEQEALVPVLMPKQVQLTGAPPAAGKVGLEGLAVPTAHNVSVPKEVAVAGYVLFAVPHTPLAFTVIGILQAWPNRVPECTMLQSKL
jgi:hypothetical protein